MTPSQQIHAICDRLRPDANGSEINLARANLRLVAEAVKAQEITLAALMREAEEEAALSERAAGAVVQFRRAP